MNSSTEGESVQGRFPYVFVNADNEQDAIDYAIDFCEEMKWNGLLLSPDDEDELAQDALNDGKSEFAYLEEHLYGGTHCRYLSSRNASVERVR